MSPRRVVEKNTGDFSLENTIDNRIYSQRVFYLEDLFDRLLLFLIFFGILKDQAVVS